MTCGVSSAIRIAPLVIFQFEMPRRSFRVGRSFTGLGLFAIRPIKKREKIAEYKGPRVSAEEALRLEQRGNRYLYEINPRVTIDGSSAQQYRALRQPFMQSQRGDLHLWRPRLHSRTTPHKARRGNHLRLRERLSQVRDRAFALPMQTLPEAARPQAERGACRKETPRRTARADAAQKALNSAQSPSDRAGCAAPPFAFGPAHQFMAMLGIRRNSPGPFP